MDGRRDARGRRLGSTLGVPMQELLRRELARVDADGELAARSQLRWWEDRKAERAASSTARFVTA